MASLNKVPASSELALADQVRCSISVVNSVLWSFHALLRLNVRAPYTSISPPRIRKALEEKEKALAGVPVKGVPVRENTSQTTAIQNPSVAAKAKRSPTMPATGVAILANIDILMR
ncbi:MAG: hypothetical protein BWY70_00109 [Bacteroidetes bacterium ADurb.Bin408]|nr:MAG: hypothetical protein BWY70_00109 [Bacteroidetes bacterium ADurb.Bin408]